MRSLLNRVGIIDKQSFYSFVKQFFKFGIVGLSNTALSLAIYYALVLISLHYILANVIAFAVSVINAYYWNNRFVFKTKEKANVKRIGKVYVVYGFTFFVTTFMLFLMVDIIGISEMIAPLINLCISVPMNFLLNKFWAFK